MNKVFSKFNDDLYDCKVRVPAVKYSGWGWDSITGIRGLPVSADIKKLRARDVIVLPACNEMVVIKSINYKNKTIDLYGRGFGTTSPYRQGIKSFVIHIAGHFTKREIDRAMTPIKFN